MSYPAEYDYPEYFALPPGMRSPAGGARVPRREIIRVTGRRGAEALQMAPASGVLALDETAPLVWLIQTDSAGIKTLTPYTITLYAEPVPVSVDELSARLARLEEILSAKSDPESTKPAAANAGGRQRRAESGPDA